VLFQSKILPFDTTQITSPQNGNNPKYGDPCHPLCATAHVPAIVEKILPKIAGTLCASGAGMSRPAGMASETDLLVCQPFTQFGNKAGTLTARADSSPCADRGMNVVCQPIAFNGRQDPVSGPVVGALDTDGGTPCIAFAVNQRDEVRDLGEKSGTIQAQPGMKQQTFIIQSATMGGNKKQNGLGVTDGPCYTLDCRADHAIAYAPSQFGNYKEDIGPIRSNIGGVGGGTENIVRTGYVVRRLTPLECERLQGFEDDWTAGGSDSARYKAIGNSIARPCVGWILKQIAVCLRRNFMYIKDYNTFIQNKRATMPPSGFLVEHDLLHDSLFDFQKDIVRWALRRGRAAIFAGTGLGKTRMQIEWAMNVHRQTGGDILLIAPLAVATQTIREGEKLGYTITMCRSQDDVRPGLNITNYEMIHRFEPILFDGVVLDESSILKSFTGKIRNELIEMFTFTPYRLACTATPAPNDYMEIGNHSEFLGVMSRTEMLSMYFVHDGGKTQKWRLKGHAENTFWKWVASWGVVLEKPSDLGYPDDGYILPPLTINDHVIEVEGELASTLSQRQKARRETVESRVAACAELVNSSDEPFLVWCDLNIESDMLTKAIPGALEVKGSDKPAHKEKALLDFAAGKIRVMVTKPSIAGFGMNWQHCAQMAFVGLSDSFEQVFQAIRRCYRFGQTRPVNVHMITSSREGATAENIRRKEADFLKMVSEMVKYTKDITSESIRSIEREVTEYTARLPIKIPSWLITEKTA